MLAAKIRLHEKFTILSAKISRSTVSALVGGVIFITVFWLIRQKNCTIPTLITIKTLANVNDWQSYDLSIGLPNWHITILPFWLLFILRLWIFLRNTAHLCSCLNLKSMHLLCCMHACTMYGFMISDSRSNIRFAAACSQLDTLEYYNRQFTCRCIHCPRIKLSIMNQLILLLLMGGINCYARTTTKMTICQTKKINTMHDSTKQKHTHA